MVLDSCQHAHGLKTHGGGLFAATTREAGREGSLTFRRAWNYERVHARVCVCVVKVDKELMVNRGERDDFLYPLKYRHILQSLARPAHMRLGQCVLRAVNNGT